MGGFFSIGGVALGKVCAFSVRSRLIRNSLVLLNISLKVHPKYTEGKFTKYRLTPGGESYTDKQLLTLDSESQYC